MTKSLYTALIIAFTCTTASADALHRNPSQAAAAANMEVFGATSIPIGAYDYCKRSSSACRYKIQMEKLALTRDVWDSIVRVNFAVNQEVVPMTDQEIFGVQERWQLPSGVGDCEDYVLEKKRRLRDIGIAPGSLRVTVVYDANNGGHAVLTVVTDQGDFVLDNNNNRVLRWQEAELTYLKRQAPGDLTRWESLRPS